MVHKKDLLKNVVSKKVIKVLYNQEVTMKQTIKCCSFFIILLFLLFSCKKDEEPEIILICEDADGNIYDTVRIGDQVWIICCFIISFGLQMYQHLKTSLIIIRVYHFIRLQKQEIKLYVQDH